MNKKELQVIAQAAAKNIKTEADLNEFRQDADQDHRRGSTQCRIGRPPWLCQT